MPERTADQQMSVELEGSDDSFFLPWETEVGTIFAVGSIEFVLERKTYSIDSSRLPPMTATGHAKLVMRAP